jgi:DNA polymerase III subunit gamma/tau
VAYLSLYRKYRPETFDDIVGQEAVANTLTNAIAEDRVAHAYLFTGPRGTGKTSTARILAKALNCVEGPTPKPCGRCPSCIAIAEGSSLDVIEMDAASHSKVDETREILSGVALATAGGRRKVYVIDEVHMLSTPSFNALLKTLEEPPAHVLFVLATTEAHKVLPTIVSRTQRFDFRRLPADLLQEHLARIAALEGIEIAPEALALVARHADGSARDALSVLDQLSSFGGRVEERDVAQLLGGRRQDALLELFDAIARGDVGGVFATVHGLVAEGADARQLAVGALGHARSLLLLKTAPDAERLLDVTVEDIPLLVEQAGRLSSGALLRTMDLLGKSLTEMRNVPNHRLLLELALVRAAAPETDPSANGLLGRIERLERRMGIEQSPAPEPAAESVAPPGPARAETPPPSSAPTPAEAVAAPEPAPVAAPAAVAADHVGLNHVKDAWGAILKEVKGRSKKVWGLLSPSRPLQLEDDVLVVEVQSDFHVSTMGIDRNRELLADSVHAALGIKPGLAFSARPPAGAAPPQEDAVDLAEAVPVADAHDPVELVKKGFGAEVVEEREA